MQYLINRLMELSTWQGIIAIVTGFGVALSPELGEAIATLGVAVFGVVSAITKERGSDDAK
jgi:ribosomal protein L11